MKVARRQRYDSTNDDTMHWTIITVLDCTFDQAVAVYKALHEWDIKVWGDNENIMPSKRRCESDEGEVYKVVFTIKGFTSIEEAKAYKMKVPQMLAKATGQKLIDDDQETLDDEETKDPE